MALLDPKRTVAELKELRRLTGDEQGAQRVAFTPTWVAARGWLREKLAAIPGVELHTDAAGNFWATLRGESERALIIGGHIDSVPNGGWLDGCLNVMAGEAAPYLLTDATETALTAAGGALAGLGYGTPLVIQDKTFVPSVAAMAAQDPTWNYLKWGGYGNLWVPHVYMPAQNPGDPTGMSAFGRWMYGPWFWPPAKDVKYPPIANPYYDANCDANVQPFCEPPLIPSTPNLSVGMEAFNDTPIVNGTAYPTTTVDPKAYRYRVLNGVDDARKLRVCDGRKVNS